MSTERPKYPPMPKKVEKSTSSWTKRSWALVKIGFYKQKVKCSPKTVVAIVDTGIDYTHPDLFFNLWKNKGEIPGNNLDDDKNGYVDDVYGWDFVDNQPLPYDTHGHGTHVAGIVKSVCSEVTIMPLKYYSNGVSGWNNFKNTVKAIEYATKNGAKIINYSGGGALPNPTERIAIDKARKKGILVVAAAGNANKNTDIFPYFPASYPLDNILSVASSNKFDRLLPTSNYGKLSVDLAAPGLSVLSTLPKSKIGAMSGTSQATAVVTGIAAVILSANPNFDYKQIKSKLLKGVRKVPMKKTRAVKFNGIANLPGSLKK